MNYVERSFAMWTGGGGAGGGGAGVILRDFILHRLGRGEEGWLGGG